MSAITKTPERRSAVPPQAERVRPAPRSVPAPSPLAPAPVAQAGMGNAAAARTAPSATLSPRDIAAIPAGLSNAALARLATPATRTSQKRPAAPRRAAPAAVQPAGSSAAQAAAGEAHKGARPAAAKPPVPAAKAPAGAAGAPPGESNLAGPPADGREAPTAAPPNGARPAVKLLMPEPPTTLSRADQTRIQQAHHAAVRAAAAHGHLPSAAAHVTAARAAVAEPTEETQGKAGEKLVEALGERPAPSSEIEKFCDQITRDIREKRPRKVEDIPKVDPRQAAESAGAQVRGSVQQEAQRVQAGYADLGKTPQGSPEQQPKPLETPPEPPPAELNAHAAAPDPVPPANVSLDADVSANRSRLEQAGMDTPVAREVKSGPLAEARAAQGELEETARQGPAPVMAEQKAALDRAGVDMAALQQAALDAMAAARRGAVAGAGAHQVHMVGTEEQMRAQLSRRAQGIFQTAQQNVQTLLDRLQKEPVERWEKGLTLYSTAFKQRLAGVEKWLKERYGGGWGAVLQFVEEEIVGLPEYVTKEYDAAELEFGSSVCALLRDISSQVNGVIAACQKIIAQARQDINDVFTKNVPAALKSWAEAQLGVFNGQLDGLSTHVTEARDNFNKDLVRRADQAVQDVRAQVQALRDKAQGILQRFAGAVERFLADPGKAILEGLLELVGIPPAAFYEVVARIKTVVNDIAKDPMSFANNLMLGIGQGFQAFFDNIGTHLLEGLLDWLLSGMRGLGIELPKDLSLKSVVAFFLQVMGLSWAKVRALLVKHVGAENVALIERAWSVVATVIEQGPAGLLEMVKQKLDPKMLFDQIMAVARNCLIEAVIKKVALRILALFNPVGAIVQAVEAIYRVLKWVFKNAAKLFRLVETVVNGVYDILKGNVGGLAKMVERALAGLLSPVIDFLADYLGVGDLPDKIADAIKALQQLVEEALDWLIGWLVEQGKKLLEAVGSGKEKKDDKKGGEVGRVVTFTAGAEIHRLRIVVSGEDAEVVMASQEKPVGEHLDDYEKQAKGLADKEKAEKVLGLTAEARGLLAKLNGNADKMAHDVKSPEATPGDVSAEGEEVMSEEDQLAGLLKEIREELGLMDPAEVKRLAGEQVRAMPREVDDFDQITAACEAVFKEYQPKGLKTLYVEPESDRFAIKASASESRVLDRLIMLTETQKGVCHVAATINRVPFEDRLGIENTRNTGQGGPHAEYVLLKRLREEYLPRFWAEHRASRPPYDLTVVVSFSPCSDNCVSAYQQIRDLRMDYESPSGEVTRSARIFAEPIVVVPVREHKLTEKSMDVYRRFIATPGIRVLTPTAFISYLKAQLPR